MTATRREFVTLGTIGLLGAKQLFAQSVVRVPGTDQGAMPILSVGYWDGLVRGDGAETPTTHILNAQSQGTDTRFRRAAALVTTYGFWRAPANRHFPMSLSLIAFYPQIDPQTKKKTPFIAWNVAVRGAQVSGSLRSRFVVPVDQNNHVEMAIDKHPLAASVDASDLAALLDGAGEGSGSLDNLAIVFPALSEHVQWRRQPSAHADSGENQAVVGPDGNPVSFDYIVLLIEPYGVTDGRDKSPADHSG